MLVKQKTTYEIWEGNTLLVDNLSFDDAAEQFLVYQMFFGDSVYVARRTYTQSAEYISSKQKFKTEWFAYFDELQDMGNIL